MPSISPRLNDRPGAVAILVIGVHREELPFGDRVAAGLDPSLVEVLRIPEGLSGRRPRQDEVFHYETLHRELYRQLLEQIRGRYPMMLDLHCGLDEDGPLADLISGDARLLACVRDRAGERFGRAEGDRVMRPVLLERRADAPALPTAVSAHTVIPPEIWNDSTFEYLAIEIFLRSRGAGEEADWELARWLIRTVVACRRNLRL